MRVTPPPDSPPPSFWFPFLRFVFKNRLSRVPTTRVVPADNKQTSRGRVSKGRNMLPSITRVPEIKGPAAATGSPAIVKWRAKGKGTTGQTHNWTRIKSKKCADAYVFGKSWGKKITVRIRIFWFHTDGDRFSITGQCCELYIKIRHERKP